MKNLFYILFMLVASFCSSCTNEEEPSLANEGSPRDWTYKGDNVKVYIDNNLQNTVSELRVHSLQLTSGEEAINNPIYDTTLKIKGLLKRDKITDISVISTLDDFEGITNINGVEYDVSGEYIGNPFETHYSDLGIIVHLNSK